MDYYCIWDFVNINSYSIYTRSNDDNSHRKYIDVFRKIHWKFLNWIIKCNLRSIDILDTIGIGILCSGKVLANC